MIKQTLDAGPYGLVLPHLDSVEGAEAAVRAARYPQVPGAPDFEPEGERGWASALAPTYWGLAPQDYCEAADVWPLDPDGELLLMGIVENVRGIDTLPDILRQVKGIGAIWAGPGICRCPWGCGARRRTRTWRQPFSRSLRSASMPACPVRPATPAAGVETRLEQGFRIVMTPRRGRWTACSAVVRRPGAWPSASAGQAVSANAPQSVRWHGVTWQRPGGATALVAS